MRMVSGTSFPKTISPTKLKYIAKIKIGREKMVFSTTVVIFVYASGTT
jgi:hypothetical protein